jgi:hypothetical protein
VRKLQTPNHTTDSDWSDERMVSTR